MAEKIKLTINELFSGIGCQSRGFKNSNLFDIEVINTSDINKESVVSYAAIHCGMTKEMIDTYADYPSREEMAKYLTEINLGYEPDKKSEKKEFDWFKLVNKKGKDLEKYWLACKLTHNIGDISRIKALPYADFWTFSFPCQSISLAGKQEGMIKGKTRSGLVYEVTRLLEKAKENDTLPKYLMLENVAALVSKKFINDFDNLNEFFNNIGYNVYWSLINGKDCGIPQNRNRCFAMYIRKDIDTEKFIFPKPFDIGIRLKDILEEKVDEKYYLSEAATKKIKWNSDNDEALKNETNILKQNGQIYGTEREPNPQAGRVYNSECLSPTLDTCNGGNRMPKILQIGKVNSSQDVVVSTDGIAKTHTAGHNNIPKIMCGIDKSVNKAKIIKNANCITTRENRGLSNRRSEGTAVCETPDLSYCLDASYFKGISVEQYFKKKRKQLVFESEEVPSIRIRKLTPKETWKLMGLTFEDCDKAASIGIADTHLYKQAGNGIITNCCELLIEHLYKAQYDATYICYDEKLYREKECDDNKKYDNFIGAAMSGRYTTDRKIEKQIEVNGGGISNAITTVQKDSLVFENFYKTPNELIFIGGIESNMWLKNGKKLSRSYKQGYRVYGSNGISCSITMNGGGLGSHTGLYIVKIYEKGDGRNISIT